MAHHGQRRRDQGAAARLDGIGGGGGYRGGGGGPPLSLLNGPATARPVFGQFFIFIFKKTKFQKYISNREILKNGCLSPLMGDRVPVGHPVGDRT